jgi:hypothetical protein
MRTLNERRLKDYIAREARRLLREAEEDEIKPGEGDELKKLNVEKGPSAAIAWLNGPGADPRVRALLNTGRRDGEAADEAAQISQGDAVIGELSPTQIEIELTKSIAFPLSNLSSLKKMISGGVQRVGPPGNDMIVTSGNLIIDGHHRWSSLFSVAGPKGQIASIDIALPEKDAASVLSIVQTAIAATLTKGQPVPKAKAGGMNILGKGKDEIASMIRSAYESGAGETGPILSDDFVSACMADKAINTHFGLKEAGIAGPILSKEKEDDTAQKAEGFRRGSALLEKKSKLGKKYESRDKIARAREHIINFVADNLSQMNPPAEGAPPRVDMPQLDKAQGGVQGALSKISTGKVNYKPPFKVVADKGAGGEKAEKGTQKEGFILERWQKLAGVLKD